MSSKVSEELLAKEIRSNKNFWTKIKNFQEQNMKILISRNLEATSFEKIKKMIITKQFISV